MFLILILLLFWLAITTQCEVVPNELPLPPTAQDTIAERTGYATLPGVGFSLGMNCGTSAIHFPNGSVITLPKVEGSEGYKQFMSLKSRDSGNEQNIQPYRFLSKNTSFSGFTNFCIPLIHTTLYKPKFEDPVGVGIRDMLSALKNNVDSQLGINLDYGTISIPYQFSRYQKDLLYSSLENLGFQRPLSNKIPNGMAVIYAYGLNADDYIFDEIRPDEEPDQVVLLVDYTSQGLGLSLCHFVPGIFVMGRLEFHEELGIENCIEELCESEKYWSEVQKAVMEISVPENFDLPLPPWPTTIGRLLFSGDLVLNDHLLCVLRNVLGNNLIERAVQDFTNRQVVRADLTYETAVGAALFSSGILDAWEDNLGRKLREEYGSFYVYEEEPDLWI